MATEDTENLKKREAPGEFQALGEAQAPEESQAPGEAQETKEEGKKRLADFPFLNQIARIMTLTTLTTLGASGIFLANTANVENDGYAPRGAARAVSTAQAATAMPALQQAHHATYPATYQALQALKEKAGEKISELAHRAGSGLIAALERVRQPVPETPAELMEHALEERTQVKRLVNRHYQQLEKGAYAPVVSATIEAYQESIGTLRAAQPPETVQHGAEKSVLECVVKMRPVARLVETADFADYYAQQCSSALAGKGRKGGKEKGKKENAYAPCKKLAQAVRREAALRDNILRMKKKERIDDGCLEALVPYLPHLARERMHAALDTIITQANGLYANSGSSYSKRSSGHDSGHSGEVHERYAARK